MGVEPSTGAALAALVALAAAGGTGGTAPGLAASTCSCVLYRFIGFYIYIYTYTYTHIYIYNPFLLLLNHPLPPYY